MILNNDDLISNSANIPVPTLGYQSLATTYSSTHLGKEKIHATISTRYGQRDTIRNKNTPTFLPTMGKEIRFDNTNIRQHFYPLWEKKYDTIRLDTIRHTSTPPSLPTMGKEIRYDTTRQATRM
ncbi:hypothetical protein B7494_g8282 [Chlorociboria aeruginascens]|nr:hypothetical protein B7494_g8282 [Chlorociboria aeruginascens]